MHRDIFMSQRFVTLLGLCLIACSGCGSSVSHEFAPVTGRITNREKPVANATVFFQPMNTAIGNDAGQGSFGVTDENGRYELKTYRDKEAGAVVGRHRVTVNLPSSKAADDGESSSATNMSPLPFRDGSLQIEVPAAGLSTADFDLAKE